MNGMFREEGREVYTFYRYLTKEQIGDKQLSFLVVYGGVNKKDIELEKMTIRFYRRYADGRVRCHVEYNADGRSFIIYMNVKEFDELPWLMEVKK